MEMLVRKPPPSLSGLLMGLWALRGAAADPYVGLPKPYVELIFSLAGEHHWRASADAPSHAYRKAWITPLQTGPRHARTLGGLHLIGARLSVTGARMLWGALPIGDGSPPLDAADVLGGDAEHIHDALASGRDDEERLTILSRWMERKLTARPDMIAPDARLATHALWRSDALAASMGLSARGLHKRFASQFGIAPKLWLQLARFDAMLRDHDFRRGAEPLTNTAYRFGFYDQAHMIAEFRRFSGCTPTAYGVFRDRGQAPDAAPHFIPR